MRINQSGFWLTLTDEEGSLIQNAIHNRITNAGWKSLFLDMKTEGETSETIQLLNVYMEIDKSEVIKVSTYQLHLILETMKKAYSKFPMEIIKKLIDDLKEVA